MGESTRWRRRSARASRACVGWDASATRRSAGLAKLRLYHEVSVSDAKNQVFEYINCHPQAGMLRGAQPAQG